MTLYGVELEEVKTRDEMIRHIHADVGEHGFRGSLETEEHGVYRVNYGSYDNSVLAVVLVKEDRYFVEKTIVEKVKLLALPNAVHERGKKGYSVPSLKLSFGLTGTDDAVTVINEKMAIATRNDLKGVGASFTDKDVYIDIPLYGNDTGNNADAIIHAFGQ